MNRPRGSCGGCWYWLNNRCQRHAPQIVLREINARGVWPITDRTDWCGEYRDKRRVQDEG